LDLHPLKGDRKGTWAVSVSGNWRITFRFVGRTGMSLIMRIITSEVVTMRMYNPPHPGEIIKSLCLDPLGVSVTQAAQALGVSRKTLSSILNGRAGISPEMAVRLSMAFGTSAESWLNQQTQYDLWHAEQRRKRLRVAKLAV
jgi:antitoxin HigA-1